MCLIGKDTKYKFNKMQKHFDARFFPEFYQNIFKQFKEYNKFLLEKLINKL